MPRQYRRVITGVNSHGKSTVIEDSTATIVQGDDETPVILTELWKTSETPDRTLVDNRGDFDSAGWVDSVDGPVTIAPESGGTLFRMCEFPPMSKVTRAWDVTFKAMGHSDDPVEDKHETGLHSTETIDYIVVVSGKITCMFEDAEVTISAGDTFVQRGTAHSWQNRTDEPCIFTSILVGATRRPGL